MLLKGLFVSNGFPKQVFELQTEKFFNHKLDPKDTIYSVDRKPFFIPFQYFGHKSIIYKNELTKLISQYFFQINPKIVLVNNFKISSFFKYKDSNPKSLCSSIVYKYCCPQNCGSTYIGSTTRTLYTRAMEHRGISDRSGRPRSNPVQSTPRDHSARCSSDVTLSDFSIVGSQRNVNELRILESLMILKQRPKLNKDESAFQLRVVLH